jgi:hypothetical protein
MNPAPTTAASTTAAAQLQPPQLQLHNCNHQQAAGSRQQAAGSRQAHAPPPPHPPPLHPPPLQVSSNPLASLEGLQACPQLTTLVATHCKLGSAEALQALRGCPGIQTLDLQGNDLGDAGVLELLQQMPALRWGRWGRGGRGGARAKGTRWQAAAAGAQKLGARAGAAEAAGVGAGTWLLGCRAAWGPGAPARRGGARGGPEGGLRGGDGGCKAKLPGHWLWCPRRLAASAAPATPAAGACTCGGTPASRPSSTTARH